MNRIVILLGLSALLGAGGYWWYSKRPQSASFDLKKTVHLKNVVPVVVIGSGPAGLSAALYVARSAVYTIVFEGKIPGGQLTQTTYVENWPGTPKMLGPDLIEQNKKQAEKFGALMINESIIEADFSQWPYVLKTENGTLINALAVIIATGANPRLLNDTRVVPGEKEYMGYGVTTCAICDAPFYKGKKVVVIGGGDSAIEEATLLTSYAQSVTIIVRGSSLRAAPAMQARLKGETKITILYNTEITEILGDGNNVTGIKIKNTKDKKDEQLPIDGVFLAIGHKPNSELFKKYLTTDKEGYVLIRCHAPRGQETSVPGVFAAGDVTDHIYRQAGVAAGDGIKAALDAIGFLQSNGYSALFAKELEKSFWFPEPKKTLAPLTKIDTIKEFETMLKKHQFTVLDIGAEHCASCKALLPVVQAVAAQIGDKAHFAQIEVSNKSQELAKRLEIKGIPVLLVFKKDKLIARYDQHGFTKPELSAALNNLFAEN